MEIHPIKTQCLIYEGIYLDDKKTLAFYAIPDRAFLEYHSEQGFPEINVFIQNSKSSAWKYVVTQNHTVAQLKKSIQESDQIPVERQVLVFGGQTLENEKTLSFYSVMDNCILTLLLQSN
uniref:Ubiquitin-like domain-containing protein n=1 Tax=Panagrolaimus sp. JU765 TaxID=591449 RepID=A0AC34RAS7_9BILA